ncbi:MAG: hypothetical protein V4726_05625 [Verrucomicrobiota bacterium]
MTPDQKQQIEDYLLSCSQKQRQRGKWDCAIFCADVLAILTGNDFAAPYRDAYSDREGAIRVLPCQLRGMPEHVGLKPSPPRDGAVWWAPGPDAEGALGIFWQGRCLQPGRRGLKAVIRDISNVRFFY